MATVKKAAGKAAPAKKAVKTNTVNVDQRWAARDDLRTIQAAAEIQNDPKRVKAAQTEAQNQIDALSKVTKK